MLKMIVDRCPAIGMIDLQTTRRGLTNDAGRSRDHPEITGVGFPARPRAPDAEVDRLFTRAMDTIERPSLVDGKWQLKHPWRRENNAGGGSGGDRSWGTQGREHKHNIQ